MAIDKEFLERIYDKQEQMADDISEIKVVLARQEENIKLHIYRTEIAEKNLELLKNGFKTVNSHVKMVQGAFKALGILSLLVGIAVGVARLLGYTG